MNLLEEVKRTREIADQVLPATGSGMRLIRDERLRPAAG